LGIARKCPDRRGRGAAALVCGRALRLVGGDGFQHLVAGRWMVEGAQRRQRLACRHLLRRALRPPRAGSMNAVAKAHHRRVLAAMTRTRSADDLVLGRRQEPLLRNFLPPAFVVVVRPRLDVYQAAAEQPVDGPVTLAWEVGASDGLE